jgi:uncharacterized damage-inducible protein DinB
VTTPNAAVADCPDANKVESARLADQLERSFRGGAWHGPSVLEALEGIAAAEASRSLVAGAHTIAELAAHIGVWIDVGRRRIEGEAVAGVPADVNFPAAGAASTERWRQTLAELEQAHRRLHTLVLGLDDERLEGGVAGSDPTVRGLLLGIVQHNAYHAGQIVMLKKAGAGSTQ